MSGNSINKDEIRTRMDIFILNSLVDSDKYALEIGKIISTKTGDTFDIKQPTIYNILKRFESRGIISSYLGEVSNGAQRRYYSLTNEGKEFLHNQLYDWKFTRTIIDNLLIDEKFDLEKDEIPYDAKTLKPKTPKIKGALKEALPYDSYEDNADDIDSNDEDNYNIKNIDSNTVIPNTMVNNNISNSINDNITDIENSQPNNNLTQDSNFKHKNHLSMVSTDTSNVADNNPIINEDKTSTINAISSGNIDINTTKNDISNGYNAISKDNINVISDTNDISNGFDSISRDNINNIRGIKNISSVSNDNSSDNISNMGGKNDYPNTSVDKSVSVINSDISSSTNSGLNAAIETSIANNNTPIDKDTIVNNKNVETNPKTNINRKKKFRFNIFKKYNIANDSEKTDINNDIDINAAARNNDIDINVDVSNNNTSLVSNNKSIENVSTGIENDNSNVSNNDISLNNYENMLVKSDSTGIENDNSNVSNNDAFIDGNNHNNSINNLSNLPIDNSINDSLNLSNSINSNATEKKGVCTNDLFNLIRKMNSVSDTKNEDFINSLNNQSQLNCQSNSINTDSNPDTNYNEHIQSDRSIKSNNNISSDNSIDNTPNSNILDNINNYSPDNTPQHDIKNSQNINTSLHNNINNSSVNNNLADITAQDAIIHNESINKSLYNNINNSSVNNNFNDKPTQDAINNDISSKSNNNATISDFFNHFDINSSSNNTDNCPFNDAYNKAHQYKTDVAATVAFNQFKSDNLPDKIIDYRQLSFIDKDISTNNDYLSENNINNGTVTPLHNGSNINGATNNQSNGYHNSPFKNIQHNSISDNENIADNIKAQFFNCFTLNNDTNYVDKNSHINHSFSNNDSAINRKNNPFINQNNNSSDIVTDKQNDNNSSDISPTSNYGAILDSINITSQESINNVLTENSLENQVNNTTQDKLSNTSNDSTEQEIIANNIDLEKNSLLNNASNNNIDKSLNNNNLNNVNDEHIEYEKALNSVYNSNTIKNVKYRAAIDDLIKSSISIEHTLNDNLSIKKQEINTDINQNNLNNSYQNVSDEQKTNLSYNHNCNANDNAINYDNNKGGFNKTKALHNNDFLSVSNHHYTSDEDNLNRHNIESSMLKLEDELYNKGYSMRPYTRFNSSITYYENSHYFINKLKFTASFILFILMSLEIMLAYIITKPFNILNIYYYLSIILVLSLLPLKNFVNRIFNPDKKKISRFNYKSNIINCLIFIVTAITLIIIFGILFLGVELTDFNTWIVPVIFPFLLLINLPLYYTIFNIIYNSKSYHLT